MALSDSPKKIQFQFPHCQEAILLNDESINLIAFRVENEWMKIFSHNL